MNFAIECLNKSLTDPKLGVMNFLNEIVNRYPGIISFAPGRPLEKNFNVEQSFGYVKTFLEWSNQGATSVLDYSSLGQYGNTKGIIADAICKLIFNDEGIVSDPSSIVVTVGCQEAMCLCLLALGASPGDVILVEDPAYVGIVGAAKLFGIEVVGIPTNENGLVLEHLSEGVNKLRAANKTPKLLYVSPDFSNPTGFSSSLERRMQLLVITRELGLVVLEDHAYNYFYLDESRIRCLKSLPGSEHVIYLGSFSKSIYPGVRIGFLVADQKIKANDNRFHDLSDDLSKIKSFLTVNSSPLNQAIVGGLLIDQCYSLTRFTENARGELKRNRDLMLHSLDKFFPKNEAWSKDVQWNRPAGGFFITLKLPFALADDELFDCANRYGVIWTPMSYFYIENRVSNSIRLSFSYVTPDQIVEGVERIARFVQDQCKKNNC